MKKFFTIMLAIIAVLTALIIYHALNFYFPSNLITKIVRGFTVVITPVLIALVIMYLINPLAVRFNKKYKFNKKVSIGLAMLIFFIVIAGLFTFTVLFMVDQGKLLYDQITNPKFLQDIKNWFNDNNLTIVYDGIIDFVKNFDITVLFGTATTVVTRFFQALASLILAPIFLWHFMNSQEFVMDKVNDNIPEKWKGRVIPLLEDSNKVIVTYFRSKLISIIILFFMFLLLYLGMGMPIGYAVLFSVVIASLDLIPYIGPSLGSIIPVIYLFSMGGTNLFYLQTLHVSAILGSVIMLSVNVLFQYIQGNIIVPQLIGKDLEINSALILVFMLFFGYVFGFWGILLAIPLGGIILVVWKHIKDTGFLLDKTTQYLERKEQEKKEN